MRYRFYTVDVFTEERFGGNPLAVLPDARGLGDAEMQKIAAEFNYSETTFVFPPRDGAHTRGVRIFTPTAELPFAGHPNIGTAYLLAAIGEIKGAGGSVEVTFEEGAGIVPITIRFEGGEPTWCELTAPRALNLGATLDPEPVAEAFSLETNAIVVSHHPPTIASAGVPFLCVQLRDRDALERSRAQAQRFAALLPVERAVGAHLYTHDSGDFDLRARMYAPLFGVPEDPATGAANCALAGLLAATNPESEGDFRWRIAQGVEMGRPSLLVASAGKAEGRVTAIRLAGRTVSMTEGWLY
jgi:trans-2,3-dihydro-3-hydroxyanthranilate isomerase